MRIKKFLAFALAAAVTLTSVPVNAATLWFVDGEGKKTVSVNGTESVSWNDGKVYVDGEVSDNALPSGTKYADWDWENATNESGKKVVSANGTEVVSVNAVSGSDDATVSVNSVTLAEVDGELKVDDTKDLTVTITYKDNKTPTTEPSITWTVEPANVASISGKKLTAKAEGTATIYATVEGVSSNTITVKVNKKDDESGSDDATVSVNSVTLAEVDGELKVGDTKDLTVTITYKDDKAPTTDPTITWTVEPATVASISGKKLTANAEGTATIYATVEGVSSNTITVKVNKKDDESGSDDATVSVNSVTLGAVTGELKVGDTKDLNVTITYKDNKTPTTDPTITWTVAPANVASISGRKLTANAEGTATIYATVENVSSNTITITVKAKADETGDTKKDETPTTTAVTGVKLDQTTLSLTAGATATLKATVEPSNATNPAVTWKSSDETVATVKDGVVTAVKAGEATITVTTADGAKTAECKVTVTEATKEEPKEETPAVKLNAKSITLKKGQSTTVVVASGLIDGDSVKSWTSSNKKVVTVKKKGKLGSTIKGVKTGSATITVTTAKGAKATLKVKVQKGTVKLTKIAVNKKNVTLKKGKTFTIVVTKTPLTAPDKVTFKSSNKKVATVTSKGVVKAKKKGTAKITVKAGKKKATVTVKVTK